MSTRISSRAGRFKKKLVTEEQLLEEAPLLKGKMAPFLELYHQKQISDCELVALFIIKVLELRYPGTWHGARRPPLRIQHHMPYRPEGLPKRLEGLSLGEIFAGFALRSTPEAVNRALLSWSSGAYPLELMFRIPSPEEVLEQQKRGRRCVTLVMSPRFVLGERDHLSFTMHDLIHAGHFYFNNASYQGQLGFYGLLDHCLREGHFTELMNNPDFKWEFEYLISDMNAYPIHLLKCLKSALIHYGSQATFDQWIADFEVREELGQLNTPAHIPEVHDATILQWLDRWRLS